MKCTSSGGHSTQTVHPPSKPIYKKYILWMSTSPQNALYRSKLCCLSCTLITSTPPKILLLGTQFFGGLRNPHTKIRKFQPDSCLHSLLPPQRDATIVARLRAAAKYPRITTLTKKYQYFLSYALSKFQAT